MTQTDGLAAAFGTIAEEYDRVRPGWPPAAIEIAARRLRLSRGAAVLDLAAGTGKLTRALLRRFDDVTAVEPLAGMREVLARELPAARVVDGAAEAIPLPDTSVEAVFCGEAFHWFDAPRAAAEIARVLRPGGGVAVLYNRRDWNASAHAWQRECHAAFEAHKLPRDHSLGHGDGGWRAPLEAALGPLADDETPYAITLRAVDLVALYGTFSTIAGLPTGRRDAALEAIRGVLDRHGIAEAEVAYRTEIATALRAREPAAPEADG
ncbi:MAG: hypothetical protein QOE28_2127 [Solirubrobacteraceae bacterium]|jgi:ubiquinone/menaquinone biosynthesis C-methylase UbiE|nr:hypothetical protein [Solirubrobacteraceae bacterium]